MVKAGLPGPLTSRIGSTRDLKYIHDSPLITALNSPGDVRDRPERSKSKRARGDSIFLTLQLVVPIHFKAADTMA